MENRKVEAQIILVKSQVEEVYKLAFPTQNTLRYSRIKKRLKTMLAENNSNSGANGFLVMLNDLEPVFKANKQLNPSSVKYDAKKQEMRILAVGNNFQAFEKFSAALPKKFSVQQGALNSSKNQVSGLLTIREK